MGGWGVSRSRGGSLGLAALLLALPAQWTAARGADVQLVGNEYFETYVANPKVSGKLLVGLRWADGGGEFSPAALRIGVSDALSGKRVCVSVKSRDGRYSSTNLYQMAAVREARPSPATFEMRSKFRDTLAQYRLDDMAVLVRMVEDCFSGEDGVYVPAAGAGGRVLSAAINADPALIKLKLSRAGGEVGHFLDCKAAESKTNIAFTTLCRWEVPADAAPGEYGLDIGVRERFQQVFTHFALRLD